METKPESYDEKLQVGDRYAKWVCGNWPFWFNGKKLTYCVGKQSQLRIGETLEGVEIKHDRNCRRTGNLYIEVAEKRYVNNKAWVKSGIYRGDNSRWYAIGDYNGLWLFEIEALRTIDMQLVTQHVGVTQKGFLLPMQSADVMAIRKITV